MQTQTDQQIQRHKQRERQDKDENKTNRTDTKIKLITGILQDGTTNLRQDPKPLTIAERIPQNVKKYWSDSEIMSILFLICNSPQIPFPFNVFFFYLIFDTCFCIIFLLVI